MENPTNISHRSYPKYLSRQGKRLNYLRVGIHAIAFGIGSWLNENDYF